MSSRFPEIKELIPHRKPMLCVDEVLAVDGLSTKTRYKIVENSLFLQNGCFSELGLLENAAQSSFIFLNFISTDDGSNGWTFDRHAVGFISQILELKVHYCPQLNDELITTTVADLVFDSKNLKICNVIAKINIKTKIVFDTKIKMILQTR